MNCRFQFMPSSEPISGRCAAKTSSGGYCKKHPIANSERCRFHGGLSTGPPKGSANNLQHGATARDRANLRRHIPDEDLAFIEELTNAYLEIAPFDRGDPRCERLTRVATMIYQEWKGQEAIMDEGMAVGQLTKSQGPDGEESELDLTVTADGEQIVTTDEHYLCARIDRLNDKIRHNLDVLGCLPDPDSAVGSDSVAQVLSVANESSESSTDANTSES